MGKNKLSSVEMPGHLIIDAARGGREHTRFGPWRSPIRANFNQPTDSCAPACEHAGNVIDHSEDELMHQTTRTRKALATVGFTVLSLVPVAGVVGTAGSANAAEGRYFANCDALHKVWHH